MNPLKHLLQKLSTLRFALALALSLPLTLVVSSSYANGNSGSHGNSGGNSGGGSSSGTQIGDATGLTTAKYHLSSWNVSGDIEVVGPVIMVIDGDFDIGNHTVTISNGGSLELYVGGNITVSGNGGINNTDVPSKLMVFGTHPAKTAGETPDYSWTLSGNGYLSGVVYAPNAEYLTNGGGSGGATLGSVVALDIRFNGSPGPFHFDEALEDLDTPFKGYSLSSYKLLKTGELTPSDSAQQVVGDSDYDALFSRLFDTP